MAHLTDNLTLTTPHSPTPPPSSKKVDRTSQSRKGAGEFPTVNTTRNVSPFPSLVKVPMNMEGVTAG